MELLIYRKEYDRSDAMDSFFDSYYSLGMKFLASDLLDQGLAPAQISAAIIKAMKVTRSSGLEIRQHFKPVFSYRNNELIRDCKLSKMGYGLVILNADIDLSIVGKLQVSMMNRFLA
ncbi:hypothetical protein DNU06_06765 [Putridiphycobacter roseus]|uniref:Uncharacterized protein n=1 Tax=Putridiphycobacter roseus TaxID=2219161 RepID=A0A2W1N152_9FLAO|nr:hypothetical protein [Putridiphycobacter roseus]PZE17524.1 hypothetical protein DNU06_06765 [Putridiphycobacter roseus]